GSDPRGGGRDAAGHHQLRDHLRDLPAGSPRGAGLSPPIEGALAAAPSISAARTALEEHPGSIWIVGGAIRDALLGVEVADADLAVEPGREEGAARAIAKVAGGTAFPLSEEHATWRVVTSTRGWHLDVAPLRAPDIEGDLRDRDFAINAVAVPLAG